MSPDLRRRLVMMLIGTMAMLVALLAADAFRARACGRAGGRWAGAARSCLDAAGAPIAAGDAARGYLLAIPLAAIVALLLWRVYAALGRRSRR